MVVLQLQGCKPTRGCRPSALGSRKNAPGPRGAVSLPHRPSQSQPRQAPRPCVARSSTEGKDTAPSVGGIPPGSSGPGGGDDGRGDGDGGGNGAGPAGALLAAGKAVESLPADLAEALASGKLAPEILQRFLDMQKNPLLAYLMQFTGFRNRLLADPGFIVKVAIELGIGICTKTTAEYTKRGERFSSQLDFVGANIVMALIADFMLVWLPAPVFSVRGATSATPGLFARAFAGCPDNAFQKVPAGSAPFTLVQRAGAVVRNGSKLFGVGLVASLLGVGITNSLIALRELIDPTFVPLNDPQNVLVMSAAYGSYMASSSNLRYQVLAGLIEERGIEAVFHSNPAACAALSFVVRTANTYLGSLLWVDYINFLGLQSIGGGH